MGTKLKRLLAVGTALTATCALTSGLARAEYMSIEPGEAISAVSQGRVTFSGGEISILCEMTLNGTLNSAEAMEAVEGRPFGSVTEVRITGCSGGTVERALSLPWPLTYHSVEGTMPNEVRAVLFGIEGARFNVTAFFGLVVCLYGNGEAGAARLNLRATEAEWVYTSGTLESLAEVRLRLARGGEACPATAGLTGTFRLSPTQEVAVAPAKRDTSYTWETGDEVRRGGTVDFGRIRATGTETRWLHIRNTGAATLKWAPESGLSGGNAELWTVQGIPAAGTPIRPRNEVTVKLLFAPPDRTPVGRYASTYQFKARTPEDATVSTWTIELVGEVVP